MHRVIARRRPGNPGIEEGRDTQRDQEDRRSEQEQPKERLRRGGEELLPLEQGHENLRNRASRFSSPISVALREVAVGQMTAVA